MTAEIIEFRLKQRPNRLQALRWLMMNKILFPSNKDFLYGPELFYGWRFIRATDGQVYFANCLDRGISEYELIIFAENPK